MSVKGLIQLRRQFQAFQMKIYYLYVAQFTKLIIKKKGPTDKFEMSKLFKNGLY